VKNTETDYMADNMKQSIPFPQSSKIIDSIRCSLSFQTLSHLFFTLDYFSQNFNQYKFNLNCIFKRIVRIKNGCIDDENYKFDINNPKYYHLKSNVLVHVSNNLII